MNEHATLAGQIKPPDFFRRSWHYFLILVVTLIYHYPLFIPGPGMPPYGDFYSYYSPLRVYAAQRLHQGEMPFLTQGLFGGYQIYADPPFAFFYPFNFLFALAIPDPSTEAALDLYILLSLLMLSISAVFLARSLKLSRPASAVAAIVMCMNGFIQMHITHIGILQVISATYVAGGLLALFAWGGGRSWRLALFAGIWLGIGNLVGHPQTSMFGHYSLGACMVAISVLYWQTYRDRLAPVRILAWSAVAVIVGVLLAAVELLPTAHLISVCSKIGMTRYEAMDENIIPRQLLSMLFPGFYIPLQWSFSLPPYTVNTLQWMCKNPLERLTFLGIAGLGLGFAGWLANIRKWWAHLLFWGGLFFVGASVGSRAPFYGWMYDYLPMVDLVRVPSRVLWLFYTAWALLAGLGIDKLLRDETKSGFRPAFLGAAAVVLALCFVMFEWLILSYEKSWLDTLISVLVEFHGDYDHLIRGNVYAFSSALKMQAIVGGLFVTATLFWLVKVGLHRGRNQFSVGVIMSLIFVEMFIYGFGRSYYITADTYDRIYNPVLDALPPEPGGRSVIPHFVHGGGSMNMAAYNGKPLANGYSPTVPTWVLQTQPTDVPPFRYGTDETLLDMWNVSDIVLRRRPTKADLFGTEVQVDDWGLAEIGAPWVPDSGDTSTSIRSQMPAELVMKLDYVTTPVQSLIVLCTSGRCSGMPDGTEVAQMQVYVADSDAPVETFPFRLGQEVADARNDEELAAGLKIKHKRPAAAYERDALWEWSDGAEMYFVRFDMPSTASLQRLVFKATGPDSSTFAVSQVGIVYPDDSVGIEFPFEINGFREVPSQEGNYRLLQRDSHPGYVWMVPEAERSSYKTTEFVHSRLRSRDFDVTRKVIVDKREFKPENSASVDSANPDDFVSTATILFQQPEKVTIKTKADDIGWLVISMAWDKGWKAWVDGKPSELSQGNGAHCALPLPAGEHEIRLEYTPVNFWLGAAVSGLTLLICTGGILWKRPRRK